MRILLPLLALVAACGDDEPAPTLPDITDVNQLAQLAPGWDAEVVAQVDQSYAGWDVEIGDADGDGHPEILTGSAPDSRIYRFSRGAAGHWDHSVLADHVAGDAPNMVLGVRVVDLDGDGHPEVLAGTGQEDGEVAALHVMTVDGDTVTSDRSVRSPANTSSYTHGLATADLDHDGVLDIVSAYCGNGEVIRYGADIKPRKIAQASGSGEDVWLADVDGDGRPEMILSNGFRDGKAHVQIYDLDPVTGDPIEPPRIVLSHPGGKGAFYASIVVGDVDNDGRPDLVVGWKQAQDRNRATIVSYRIAGAAATITHTFAEDDADLDLAYFEKMMAIADVDGDGANELVVSTRGDGSSEGIDSAHLGHVYAYRVDPGDATTITRELVVDFDAKYVESSWLAVGDADGDGVADLVLATGKGDRLRAGTSWVIDLHKHRDQPGQSSAASTR